MTTVSEEIAKLQENSKSRQSEIDQLTKLLELFPDLKKHVGRWNKVAFYSSSVNSKVSGYDQRFNCGCCSDSPLEVWPYLDTPFGKVFSDPPCFTIGEKCYYGGATPYPDWQERLEKAGIPGVVIGSIEEYFSKSKEDALNNVELAYGRGSIEDPEPLI
jgi:hypothetical protein